MVHPDIDILGVLSCVTSKYLCGGRVQELVRATVSAWREHHPSASIDAWRLAGEVEGFLIRVHINTRDHGAACCD